MRYALSARGRLAALPCLITVVVMVTAGVSLPAAATPGTNPADSEGGSPSLQTALENASRGYTDAKKRLAASRKRQADLVRQQAELEKRMAPLSRDAEAVAEAAYSGARVDMLAAAFESRSIPGFLDRSAMLEYLSWQNNEKVDTFRAARDTLDRQRRKIDAEVRVQAAQEKAMAKRKADAERALAAVGGTLADGYGRSGLRAARSGPRGWGSCSMDDPTTSGCLTPRMAHALSQARAIGFTRYTRCFRLASFGEHGKGRACDFAASASGFGGAATGGDRTYGNRMAAWFVDNADRLGVLYVIWYRQIWMPGLGWRSYSGGGSPSSAHTNHIHLSVQ